MPTSKPKPTTHGLLWWVFCSPGAILLQLDYLFPDSIRGSFGTARRRKVVWIQFLYTLGFYAFVAVAVWTSVMKPKLVWAIIMVFATPLLELVAVFKRAIME